MHCTFSVFYVGFLSLFSFPLQSSLRPRHYNEQFIISLEYFSINRPFPQRKKLSLINVNYLKKMSIIFFFINTVGKGVISIKSYVSRYKRETSFLETNRRFEISHENSDSHSSLEAESGPSEYSRFRRETASGKKVNGRDGGTPHTLGGGSWMWSRFMAAVAKE